MTCRVRMPRIVTLTTSTTLRGRCLCVLCADEEEKQAEFCFVFVSVCSRYLQLHGSPLGSKQLSASRNCPPFQACRQVLLHCYFLCYLPLRRVSIA